MNLHSIGLLAIHLTTFRIFRTENKYLMTPGINTAKKARITYKVHEYTHDPYNTSYVTEAAEKIEVPEELVVSLDEKHIQTPTPNLPILGGFIKLVLPPKDLWVGVFVVFRSF